MNQRLNAFQYKKDAATAMATTARATTPRSAKELVIGKFDISLPPISYQSVIALVEPLYPTPSARCFGSTGTGLSGRTYTGIFPPIASSTGISRVKLVHLNIGPSEYREHYNGGPSVSTRHSIR